MYLLKLHKSGGIDGETQKEVLVLESGTRFHLSKYSRDKSNTPSNFCLKLRKHVRTKRIEKVEQVGIDRIVDFTIGSGPARHHLILELYSQGNVILTDGDYKVLTLLRSHRDDANEFAIMANHPYPIDRSRTRTQVTPESVAEAAKANAGGTLRALVGKALPYGNQIAEHCVLLAGRDPKAPVEAELPEEEAAHIAAKINEVEEMLAFCGAEVPKGYIFVKGGGDAAKPEGDGDQDTEPRVYDIFEPFLTRQSESKPHQCYETFDEAVDEFYSSAECQKQEVAKHQEKKQIASKLDKIKNDQDARITSLRNQALSTNKKAQLIEYNLESVDAAINAVNEALASGFDWKELDQMIQSEKEAGNPVASLVSSLQLDRNAITLRLENNLDDPEEEGEGGSRRGKLSVQVDLGMTAHANARALYQQRKKHEAKESKTVQASQRALKQAEKQASTQMKKLKVTAKPGFKVARKQYWFEKFDWFVSSENYLVVSGRDAQQNELLVKRYLTTHDVYVHADIHGAASCVVRNRVGGGPIPPTTLLEAGSFCVCHSQAWNSKFTTGSWWVHSSQVSKTAPSGEYLSTGSFMIRGKKNFLQPTQLLMGFTVLFKLDEESVEAHLGERACRSVEEAETVADAAAAAAEEEEEEEEEAMPALEAEDGDEDEEDLSLLDTSAALSAAGDEEEEYEQVGYVAKTGGGTSSYTAARERQRHMEESSAARAGNGGAEGKGAAKGGAQPPKKSVRGKRGKKKKMKKYADQDDEDRELAMMLLGNPGGKKKEEAKKAVVDSVEVEGGAEVERAEAPAKGQGAEEVGRGKPNRAEDAPVAQQLTHDGDVEIMNSLTGLPREDDILHFCLPMCAPYSAIMQHKYKVKVQPGNLKKGKAAKTAMEMLIKTHEPEQREYDLLRAVPEQEVVAAMVGNSKPSVSFRRGQVKGLSKATTQGKGGKKKGKGKKKR